MIQHEFYYSAWRFPCSLEPILQGEHEPDWQYLDRLNFIKIVKFIQAHPNLIFEIASHTDWRGSAASNLDLSKRRAQALVDCMIRAHNIDSSQLKAVGYGREKPRTMFTCDGNYWVYPDDSLALNCEEMPEFVTLSNDYINQFKATKVLFERLHQFNRRVEVKIVGIRE